MTTVALFRNMNLGHPGSPTGEELLTVFGGPQSASIFQTNGTVLLTGPSARTHLPRGIDRLRAAGYTQPVVIRSSAEIHQANEHAAEPDRDRGVYRTMVSFFDVPSVPQVQIPMQSRDRLVELRELEAGVAVSFCWKPGSKAGDVNRFVESLVNASATTRSLGTLRRLLERVESDSV